MTTLTASPRSIEMPGSITLPRRSETAAKAPALRGLLTALLRALSAATV